MVTRKYSSIPYMAESNAKLLRKIVIDNSIETILEVGFYQGKSSAYIASMLEDLGRGHLTTVDLIGAIEHKPNIHDLLQDLNLTHRVTISYAKRSFTWELQKSLHQGLRSIYDMCYFDGGHTWDNTGFGVLLVDMLLKPGGILILDDMNWSIAKSKAFQSNSNMLARYCQDEIETETVRRVTELILPHLGYYIENKETKSNWCIARKPFSLKCSDRFGGN